MTGLRHAFVCSLAAGLACAAGSRAQCPLGRLTAVPPVGSSQFGRAVALGVDVAIVGAPLDDLPGAADAGAAYVFRKVAGVWTQETRLTAGDPLPNAQFGRTVAISGDVAIVGAPLDDPAGLDSGSAYVFRRSPAGVWAQEAKLLPIESGPGDQFGASVAYDGDFVLVGAPNHDENGFDSGCAFIFTRSAQGAWSEETRLVAADGAPGDQYGKSAAVGGQYFMVGAPRRTVYGTASGAAYIRRRLVPGVIVDDGRIIPDDGEPGDEFGSAVAVRGLSVVVGAPMDNSASGDDTGSAYVFLRVGPAAAPWQQQSKLLPTVSDPGGQFGQSVAVETDAILIGAGLHGADNAGQAQVFLRRPSGFWQAWSVIVPTDLNAGSEFGVAVALRGTTAAVGGRGLGWAAPNAGGVGLVMVGRRPGDANGDGAVDFLDLNFVLSDYGQGGGIYVGDVNLDGAVDFLDLNIVLGTFGTSCP